MSEFFGVKVRIGPRGSARRRSPAQGEQTSVRRPEGSGNPASALPLRPGAVSRILAPMTQVETQTEDALGILLSDDLDPIVDMVLRRRGDGTYEAAAHDGSVTFRRTGPGPDDYETVGVTGANPFADTGTDRFGSLEEERAHPFPRRTQNAHPFAFDHTAQLFDSPAAPDLCVIHSAAHNWEDQGGHLGEHGSLGIVQARAPWVIAGKGVRNDGVAPKAARLVDVAPTIAALLGCRAVG